MEDPHNRSDTAPGLVEGSDGERRCFWAGTDRDYISYHDHEWGMPVGDDRALFEKICLEGFQAGLSWLTILRKRENFREAFEGFEFERVAGFSEADVERLLGNTGIVRHRGKIEATINNARRARALASETGSLSAYFWGWEPDEAARPARIDYPTLQSLTSSRESTRMSKDLRRRGWKFVGPTTAYAFMQSMGMVNDHIEGCCKRVIIDTLRAAFERPAAPRT